jgi:prevent-host-death family protein
MTSITLTEMARNLSEYINRVVYRHERFVLTRANKPVAELNPVPTGRTLADLPALLKSLPHLLPGDAADFERDIEASRKDLLLPSSPWQS